MNNKKPEFFLYIAVALLLAMLIGTAFYYISLQQNDAVRINLAGRQRMLSQKIVKELLLYSSGEVAEKQIAASLKVFSQTQEALINGGPAPMTLDFTYIRVLPPLKKGDAHEKFMEVEEMRKPFERETAAFMSHKNRESLEYITSNNDLFLKKINESVYALQKKSEKNSSVIQAIIIILFLIISFLFIIYTYRKIAQLREADKRIKELETLLPICSSCKKIRLNNEKPMDMNSWTSIEEYLNKKNEMTFTHTVCPDCMKKLYPGIK